MDNSVLKYRTYGPGGGVTTIFFWCSEITAFSLISMRVKFEGRNSFKPEGLSYSNEAVISRIPSFAMENPCVDFIEFEIL